MEITNEQATELYDNWYEDAYSAAYEIASDKMPEGFYCWCGFAGDVFVEKDDKNTDGGWACFLEMVTKDILDSRIYEGMEEEDAADLSFESFLADAEDYIDELEYTTVEDSADKFAADMEAATTTADLQAIDRKYDLCALGRYRSREYIEKELARLEKEMSEVAGPELVQQRIIASGFKSALANPNAVWFKTEWWSGYIENPHYHSLTEDEAFEIWKDLLQQKFDER